MVQLGVVSFFLGFLVNVMLPLVIDLNYFESTLVYRSLTGWHNWVRSAGNVWHLVLCIRDWEYRNNRWKDEWSDVQGCFGE